MRLKVVRTLVVVMLGASLALGAFAGQALDRENPVQPLMVRSVLVGEYRFDYCLVDTVGQAPYAPKAQGGHPELLLFISDSDGRRVHDANVKYRVVTPRRTQLQARGLPVDGGFSGGIVCDNPGIYAVSVHAVVSSVLLKDQFACDLLAVKHDSPSLALAKGQSRSLLVKRDEYEKLGI